ERNQCKHGGDDDDGVHTCSLPITAAEVQPHAEFIEGQSHGHAIEQGRDFRGAAHRPPKDTVAADTGEQKNSVVEVMDMRAFQEKIKIRYRPRHDQKNKDARNDERDDETEKGPACQPMGGFFVNGSFSVHAIIRETASAALKPASAGQNKLEPPGSVHRAASTKTIPRKMPTPRCPTQCPPAASRQIFSRCARRTLLLRWDGKAA